VREGESKHQKDFSYGERERERERKRKVGREREIGRARARERKRASSHLKGFSYEGVVLWLIDPVSSCLSHEVMHLYVEGLSMYLF
jgi:hypothetical protein